MSIPATGHDHRRRSPARGSGGARRSMLAISGSLIALFGVVLTIVSTSSFLNSSSFFQLTGLGLILSGALLAKRHIAGAWTYLAVVAATLSWSLHDVGRGGSTVAYRIAGPIIMGSTPRRRSRMASSAAEVAPSTS